MQQIGELIELLEKIQLQHSQPILSEEQYEMLREEHNKHQRELERERLENQIQSEQFEEQQPPIDPVDSKRGGCKLYQQAESIQIL